MPIQSYDLTNQIRDVSAGLEFLRQSTPTLFSLATIGANVKNRTAEWVDKVLGVTFVDVSLAEGLNVTVPDGDVFTVGMELSPLDTADNYIVESISGNVLTVKKANPSMDNPVVGRYEVSNGGVLESALTGPQAHWKGINGLNYVQIFRGEAELTALAEGTNTYDGQNEMAVQEADALTKLYHDINKNMWKGYKALGNTTEAGRMGGIYEFCSALKTDAGNKAVTKDMINAALELVANNGGKPNYLVCNRVQIGALSKIYENQVIVQQDDPVRGTYVSKIRNPYAPDGILQIIVDDICPRKDIWFADASKIEFDFHEKMPLQSIDSTPKGFIGQQRTVSCAGTVKWHNAGQCFASIRNLKY